MLKQYELQMPKLVYGGEDSLEKLQGVLAGAGKAAVFTDKGIAASGLLDLVLEQIKKAGKPYAVFDELPPEPAYGQVQKLVDQFHVSGADVIVAVGGGSVMDTAKLASVLKAGGCGVKGLLENPKQAEKCIPTVMIPTTAGTGAEATPNAIVAVPEQESKVGIVSPEMVADYVILDPQMIKNLPRKLAASTGVDALCHALECWTSKKANAFSDMYAMEALDLILNNLVKACDSPDAIPEKIKMQTASFYAGVAITASGTTAVHALSYPLGGKYHIAHGVSNAILLMPVMKFNEPVCRSKFAAVYDRCAHGRKGCTTEAEKSAYVLAWLNEIVRRLDIPGSLREFGVPEGDLEDLVYAGMGVQRLLGNNMREVSAEDARRIYLEILR